MKKQRPTNTEDLDFGDIGGMEMPDFDASFFDIVDGSEQDTESRYTKPKVYHTQPDFVMYDNAVKLAKDIKVDFGQRADALVSGNFIFGDFIEALLTTHDIKATAMTISTLSLSQNNVDSLHNLLQAGYIDELNLIVSAYFYANEIRSLIPYIYRELDIGNRFQLAVAGIHTKTCQFTTEGGRHIIIHGSANLRSSSNIEQFTIEENADLYAFYDGVFSEIVEKYATIRKPIRGNALWEDIIKLKFND